MDNATLLGVREGGGYAHTTDTVNAALTELALVGGSARRAIPRLQEKGVDVARSTLELWRDDQHAELYASIRDDRAAQVQRVIAAEHEDLAIRGAEVTRALLERTRENLDEIPARDLPGAVRNIATATAIATDKALMARERPVAMPAETRSIDELVRGLIALGVAREVGVTDAPNAIDATCEVEERTPPPRTPTNG